MTREHELKVWPPFFDALADGSKTFEVRKDDRGIQSGDLLRLREWQPFEGGAVFYVSVGDYTGRETTARVGYVLRDEDAHEFGVRPGYCVLALIPAPHPQGGTETLRAVVAAWDDSASVEPCESCQVGGYNALWHVDDERRMDKAVDALRALLAAAPAPTEAGDGE